MSDKELVVTREKLDSFLPLIGCEVDDDGYIRDIETGEIQETESGEQITIDEMGYLKSEGNQKVTPIKDNFSNIVSGLSDREFREE